MFSTRKLMISQENDVNIKWRKRKIQKKVPKWRLRNHSQRLPLLKLNNIHVVEFVKVYEIATSHEKVFEANVFVNKAGVTDVDLCNKIRATINRNKDAVKDFLFSEEIELHLEFLPKINRRKRSGLDSILFLRNKIYIN